MKTILTILAGCLAWVVLFVLTAIDNADEQVRYRLWWLWNYKGRVKEGDL